MESARFRFTIWIEPVHESPEDGIQVRFTAGTLRGSAYIGGHVQQTDKFWRTFIFILLQVGSCSRNFHHETEINAKKKEGALTNIRIANSFQEVQHRINDDSVADMKF